MKLESNTIGPSERLSSTLRVEQVSFIDLLDNQKKELRKRRFVSFTVWLKNNISKIIWLIAFIVIILGYKGYYEYFSDENRSRSPVYIIYSVIQLFLIVAQITPDLPWELQVAFALAPLVTGYAGLTTLAKIFHEKLSLFRIRMGRNHGLSLVWGIKVCN